MIRIDDKVVNRARGTAQRHIIKALEAEEHIADDRARLFGDEDRPIPAVEVRNQEVAVSFGHVRTGREKSQRIELVMLLDEHRPEAAESALVGGRCRAYSRGRHHARRFCMRRW